jgi:hypothetical protein
VTLSRRRPGGRRVLQGHGIAEEQITVRFHGERYPLAKNNSAANRARNRRVIQLDRAPVEKPVPAAAPAAAAAPAPAATTTPAAHRSRLLPLLSATTVALSTVPVALSSQAVAPL